MFCPAATLTKTRDLNQGDILASVPRLLEGLDKHHIVLNGNPQGRGPKTFSWPAPDEALRTFAGSVRVVQRVERLDFALVLSNSCDNYNGTTALMLAPIMPFKLPEGQVREQWETISSAATSSGSPKYFYLPKSSLCGFGRSEAQLGDMYLVSHELLQKYVDKAGTQRVATLHPDATRHLQWQLSLVVGRNPRDDFSWMSLEDLLLKEQWLAERLTVLKDDAALTEQLREIRAHIEQLKEP